MKLLSFEIDGLLGRPELISHTLNDDLNVLTGRNGAGKTSILKLLWSIISGNIYIGLVEVDFKRVTVITDEYECTVHRLGPKNCKVSFLHGGKSYSFEDEVDSDGDSVLDAEDQANIHLRQIGNSVFFPTFRRIEGGFTISPSQRSTTSPSINALTRQVRARSDIEDALINLSRILTNDPHIFVTAISTVDITTLLLRIYTDLSEQANRLQTTTSQEIIGKIKNFNRSGDQADRLKSALTTLDDVRTRVETMETNRQAIMAPLDEVQELVVKLFQHSGIRFNARVSFGDAAKAVNSDALSAGEKQMLSFLCYNAFYKNSVIFIDEPELSLHADWQRQLFPILERQLSSNQFLIATHSPFIYAKYPDKEIEISKDHGDLG